MPTGQVFKWHFLIIVHPKLIKGAVENAYSSAPSNAAMVTSLPTRKIKTHVVIRHNKIKTHVVIRHTCPQLTIGLQDYTTS